MKKTLQKINELVDKKVIEKYAIAGGIAQFYYIEPSVTYDLDLIVNFPNQGKKLNLLEELYSWARSNSYTIDREHIVIEGIPVQFLSAYNDLVIEALENAYGTNLFEEKTYILKAEYLMAIMLQTGRAIDKERLVRFFDDVEYDHFLFDDLVNRFGLTERLIDFRRRYES